MNNSTDVTHQFSLGEILEVSWSIFQKHWQKFIGFGIVFIGIFVIIGLSVYYSADFSNLQTKADDFFGTMGTYSSGSNTNLASIWNQAFLDSSNDFDIKQLVSQYIMIFGISFFTFFLQMVIAIMVYQCSKNEEPDLRYAIEKALSKFHIAFITSLIFAIIMLGLVVSIIFIIGAIILSIYWNFYVFAIVLRDEAYIGSLSYSIGIVKGRWWTVLLYVIVLSLMVGIINMLITLPTLMMGDTIHAISVSLIIGAVTTVFYAITQSVMFINFEATTHLYNR